MKRNIIFRLLISTILLAGLALWGPNLADPALAIGPGTGGSKIRVNDEKIGPYVLLAATSPLPVRVGQMSVWVRVTDAATDELHREATVMVQAVPRAGGEALAAAATHQNAGNDYDYVAHFDVTQTGQWDITITVDGEPGQVETAFTETVTRGLSTNILIIVAIPFVILTVVVGVFLWRRAASTAE